MYVRALNIRIENRGIEDGVFCWEVAKTLRDYADAIDAGKMGNTGHDHFIRKSRNLGTTTLEARAENFEE